MNTYFQRLGGLCLLFLLGLLSTTALGQVNHDRCATVHVHNQLQEQNPRIPSLDALGEEITSAVFGLRDARVARGVLKIPIVVHIVHTGQAVGTTNNITDEQVLSQIFVLNEDFRKSNGTRGFNNSPVGADSEIEFVMAKRDPSGNATNGIRRYDATVTGWPTRADGKFASDTINTIIKPATIWDPSRYMNVWVIPISGTTLGFATFPPAPSSVAGVGNCGSILPNNTRDGVVGIPDAFGTLDRQPGDQTFYMNPGYAYGRTMTHEVGHYLGLFHTWGDGDCTVDDRCDDTPNVSGQHYQSCNNTGTPTATVPKACDGVTDRMIENYMDYSQDACMNIFTRDQKARMRAIMLTSRQSLTYSDAFVAPVANDVALVDVIKPVGNYATGTTLAPQVRIVNRGTNALTSASVSYQVDGGTPITTTWNGNLSTGASATVTLNTFTTAANAATQTFSVTVSSPNGQTDTNTDLDNITFRFQSVAPISDFPVTETFETMRLNEEGEVLPAGWSQISNNNTAAAVPTCYYFEPHSATGSQSATSTMLRVNNFQFNSKGTEIMLYSPVVNLNNTTAATLTFEVSYAEPPFGGSEDALRVEVSTDGGNTWNATPIYNKAGAALSTVAGFDGNTPFNPTASNQWRAEATNLAAFLNNPRVQFRFVATNQWGQNLYMDNVRIDAAAAAALPEISVTVAPASVAEDAAVNSFIFTFTSSVAPATDLTVNFSVGGTATFNQDYTVAYGAASFGATSGTIVIPAGQTTASLTIQTVPDNTIEPDETIILTVTAP